MPNHHVVYFNYVQFYLSIRVQYSWGLGKVMNSGKKDRKIDGSFKGILEVHIRENVSKFKFSTKKPSSKDHFNFH